MTILKNVVLVGAGGNVGRYILQALLDDGFNVTVMSRADSISMFEGVSTDSIVRGDYTRDFFRKALAGQDALVLALGSGVLEAQKEMIEVAAELGVRRIIPSEFGSDTGNKASLDALPFNRAKTEIIDHLTKVVNSNPKTSWTALVTGPFFDWCLGYGLFGFDTKNHKATIYDEGTVPFDVTNIGTVGKTVARLLEKPDEYQNQRVYISGLTITQLDIFEVLKRATGVQNWEVGSRTAESLRKQGQERLSKNDFMGMLDLIDASLFQAGNGSNFSSIHKLENDELGVKDNLYETVQEYVKAL